MLCVNPQNNGLYGGRFAGGCFTRIFLNRADRYGTQGASCTTWEWFVTPELPDAQNRFLDSSLSYFRFDIACV